jgi:glutamine synthetase
VLAAGMKGIEEGYDLPREAEDDVWSLSERERQSLGIKPLPRTLYDAIHIAENSELLAETLGEHVFDFFLRNKRAEWEEYRGQVSAFERDRMLPVL